MEQGLMVLSVLLILVVVAVVNFWVNLSALNNMSSGINSLSKIFKRSSLSNKSFKIEINAIFLLISDSNNIL